jgi:hypothetical protein
MNEPSTLAKLQDEALGEGIKEAWEELGESFRSALAKSKRLTKELAEYLERISPTFDLHHADVQYLTERISKEAIEMEAITTVVDAWEVVLLKHDGEAAKDALINEINREIAGKARTAGTDRRLLLELSELADHLSSALYMRIRTSGPGT